MELGFHIRRNCFWKEEVMSQRPMFVDGVKVKVPDNWVQNAYLEHEMVPDLDNTQCHCVECMVDRGEVDFWVDKPISVNPLYSAESLEEMGFVGLYTSPSL
jgi:hypothetical protein